MRARWATGVHPRDGYDLPGRTAGPGTRLGLPTPVSSWDHHASRLASLCRVYFTSRLLAARNIPFLHVNPTQSASWPGLWVLPKHTAGCSPWIWLFRDVKCWRPRAALGVTAQAALPALPCAGCPSEWSRLGGSVAARQMLSCSHPRPIRQPDRKLGNP